MPGKLDRLFMGLWIACRNQLKGAEDATIEVGRHVGSIELLPRLVRDVLDVVFGVVLGQLATQFIAGTLEFLRLCRL